MQLYLHHDFEGFSQLDLTKVGAHRYFRDPSTVNLMCAWELRTRTRTVEPMRQWVPEEGEKLPRDLELQVKDPSIIKVAWNAGFERLAWLREGIDVPLEQWWDPMAVAFASALPGDLDKCGEVLKLPDELRKDARGKRLMREFSKPHKPSARKPWLRTRFFHSWDNWQDYKEYNRQDVVAEVANSKKLWRFDLSEDEWETWRLDQRINDRGVPVNRAVVENAIRITQYLLGKKTAQMAAITGLENPGSVKQLLPWLRGGGYPFEDLQKAHVKRFLARCEEDRDLVAPEVIEVLELRQEVSKTSVKKFSAMAARLDEDNAIRGCFQFSGAGRTNRWSGRGVQFQNLVTPLNEFLEVETNGPWVVGGPQIEAVRMLEIVHPNIVETLYDKPLDWMASCVRSSIQAPPGMVFIDCDLNAVENRVLGWLADDEKILRVFRKGLDPYIDFATHLFGVAYADIVAEVSAGNKYKRKIAKPPVLGCGYMLSAGKRTFNERTGEEDATGLIGYALDMGVELTDRQAEDAVRIWRRTYRKAVNYWDRISSAAEHCIRAGKPTRAGHIRFRMNRPFLEMVLPSGRPLRYCRPRWELWRVPWGGKKLSITYEGLDQVKRWVRMSTHPGKLVENADQAVARDLLVHGMKLAEREGLKILIHVHDQLVPAVPEDQAEDALVLLNQCMSEVPSWAAGLPLGSEGVISKWFIKD